MGGFSWRMTGDSPADGMPGKARAEFGAGADTELPVGAGKGRLDGFGAYEQLRREAGHRRQLPAAEPFPELFGATSTRLNSGR
jgi:hypothetical protein